MQQRMLKKLKKSQQLELKRATKKASKPLSAAAQKRLERMQRKAAKLKQDVDKSKAAKAAKVAKAAHDTASLNNSARDTAMYNNSNCFFDTDEYNDLDMEALNAMETQHAAAATHHSQLVFEIVAEDGFRVVSQDMDRAWRVIVDRVRQLRVDHKLKPLSYRALSGARMYGLCARATVFMLEQMEAIEFCPRYTSKYIARPSGTEFNTTDASWTIDLNNSARTSRHRAPTGKTCLDQFYWLAADYRSLNCLNLGMRFDQQFAQASKALTSTDMCTALKFRHLKEFSKSALLVKRSLIHGRGLFTLVDLNQGQMIVEYAGEIIRNELCERREKYYESKVGVSLDVFIVNWAVDQSRVTWKRLARNRN